MSGSDSDRRDRSFAEDERAIEGLPIRLVIALVVGVAALAIMMQVLGTFDFGAEQEADVDFNGNAIVEEDTTVTITIVDAQSGEPIPDADVFVEPDTLALDGSHFGTANDEANFTFEIRDGGSDVDPNWRTTQDRGKLGFDITAPQDSPYTDDQANDKMTVVRDD